MNARAEAILIELAEENPQALLLDDCVEALIGIGRRCGQPAVAVYDYDLLVEVFQQELGYEGAVEWVETNIVGAWLGENTPIVVDRRAGDGLEPDSRS